MRTDRMSIVATSNGQIVGGLVGRAEVLRTTISDREANGHAFPGERVVRLPRRMCRGRRWADNYGADVTAIMRWTWAR